jgi:hypothetical protein
MAPSRVSDRSCLCDLKSSFRPTSFLALQYRQLLGMAEISLRPRKNLTSSAASTTLLVCLDGLSKLIKSWAEYLFRWVVYLVRTLGVTTSTLSLRVEPQIPPGKERGVARRGRMRSTQACACSHPSIFLDPQHNARELACTLRRKSYNPKVTAGLEERIFLTHTPSGASTPPFRCLRSRSPTPTNCKASSHASIISSSHVGASRPLPSKRVAAKISQSETGTVSKPSGWS